MEFLLFWHYTQKENQTIGNSFMKDIIKKIIAAPHFPKDFAWKRRNFHKNEIIVEEGDDGGSLFFIEQGKLRVSGTIELEEKKHIQAGIWELEEEDIFGEIALYTSQSRTASVKAITDGCLIEINGKELSVYLDDHPDLGYLFFKDLFEILIARLNRANHRVNDLFAWGLKVHDIEKHL